MSGQHTPALNSDDWHRLGETALRRMRFHLRSASREELDDCVQEVLLGLSRFISRSGMPDSTEALMAVICRRVAVTHIRERYRRGASVSIDDLEDQLVDERALVQLREIEDEVALLGLRVIEFFRSRNAKCLEPALARAGGMDLKELGAATGDTHTAMLKRWSRCMEQLKRSIAQGEPGLEGLPGWGGMAS